MSIELMTRVFKAKGLTTAERMVLVIIADHSNEKGYSFPGTQLIAERASQSVRNTLRLIAKVARDGWVVVQRKSAGDSLKGNSYQLNLDRLYAESAPAKTGDRVSPEPPQVVATKATPEAPRDTLSPEGSGDNAGTVQVTNEPCSGDKSRFPILINHQEPPKNHQALPTLSRPGRPSGALQNPDVDSMVRRIIVAHPWSLLRQTRWNEVTQAHQQAVLRAMSDEMVATDCSAMVALQMILDRVELQAQESPPDQLKYFKEVERYMLLHEYRLEPEVITRKDKPYGNATATRHANRAQQRTDSQLDALHRADELAARWADTPPARDAGIGPQGTDVGRGSGRVLQGA